MSGRYAWLQLHPLWFFTALISVIGGWWVEWLIIQMVVFVHELGHLFMGRQFGWKATHMHFTVLGGMIDLQPQEKPRLLHEWLVALAGPSQHLILLVIGHSVQWLWWESLNWTMFFLNILPFWPLDGGRLCFTLIMRIKDKQIILKWFHGLAVLSATLLIIGGIMYQSTINWNLVFLGLFLLEQNVAGWNSIRWQLLRQKFQTDFDSIP
jgi:stage IV sporulation protein FB